VSRVMGVKQCKDVRSDAVVGVERRLGALKTVVADWAVFTSSMISVLTDPWPLASLPFIIHSITRATSAAGTLALHKRFTKSASSPVSWAFNISTCVLTARGTDLHGVRFAEMVVLDCATD